MTGRIFFKLLLGVFGLLLAALLLIDYFATQVSTEAYIANLRRQLADKGRMLALSITGPDGFRQEAAGPIARAAGSRLTVVRSDGVVIADSEANPAQMENHRTRPELIHAFRGETGSIIRHSATIGIDFLYVAVPIPNGAIRLAVPLSEIDAQVRGMRLRILGSTVLGFLPAIAIAALLARLISRRFGNIMAHAMELARGNFRSRLPAIRG